MHDSESPGSSNGKNTISTLPNEVLALVLEQVHKDYYLSGDSCRHPSRIENTITCVCALWRSIALSLPTFWATFQVKRPQLTQISKEFQRLQVHLSRSGDADLDLSFNYVAVQAEDAVLMQMLSLVVPHLRRLRRFVLLSDRTNFVTPFYTSLTGVSAPRLEHFEVCTGKYHNILMEGYDGLPHWDPRILTEGPPNIKYLRLDSSASARFRPPFQNLVHFSLESGSAPLELHLLWVCLVQILSLPFLETLSLWDNVIAPPDHAVPLIKVEARRLKHVRIGRNERQGPLFYILHYITAPLLETLTISSLELYSLNGLIPIAQDAHPDSFAFPSLRSLYLVNVEFPLAANTTTNREIQLRWFKQIAARTAKIKHLSISTGTHLRYNDILEALQGRCVGEGLDLVGLWPDVHELDLNMSHSCTGKEMTPAGLLQFCSRYWGRLDLIRLPPPSIYSQWPRIELVVEGSQRKVRMKDLERLLPAWPPGYALPSHKEGARDPFFTTVDGRFDFG